MLFFVSACTVCPLNKLGKVSENENWCKKNTIIGAAVCVDIIKDEH